MIYTRFLLSMLFVLALLASAASAQGPVRTFVASTGSDANPCNRTAPCRTFQAAVDAVAAGGEVVALDSAGFGSNVSITKSVSIIASPGIYAGITVFSGVGIDINAGAAQDTIILRGLTVINQSFANLNIGIHLKTGRVLHIESCIVSGFKNGGFGVNFEPTDSSDLEVKDSIIRDGSTGIWVSGINHALIDQVRLENCNFRGLVATDGASVTARNSTASRDAVGFLALCSSASAEMNIENCVVSNGIDGIDADSAAPFTATVRVSNCTVTNNGTGLSNLGTSSVILSRKNNTVQGNEIKTSGTIGTYSPD